MKICVLIPSLNEAASIGNLVSKIARMGFSVVVVDDGSSDATSRIASAHQAIVLRNIRNEGKGASLIRGFGYCLAHNFDAVVTMDGDGQHAPEEIPHFIEAAENASSSLVIGNRMSKMTHMPFERVLTNRFMSWLISKISKQHIPDTQCGFRLIKNEVLRRITLSTSKYETESQILIRASRAGFAIVSIPITTIYNGGKSRINPFIDTLRFLKFIFKEVWSTKS